MAKHRYVNTKFWSDCWVTDLDPVEKLLFIYLLTNEKTTIAGIYELPLKIMAVETGIEKDMIEKILIRFKKDKRVFYKDGWIYVKNFIKHQTANPSISKGIELAKMDVPPEIMAKIRELEQSGDSLGTGCIEPGTYPNSNPNLNSNTNTNIILSDKVAEVDLNSLINLFKPINPSYKTLFSNKTQRSALNRLVKEHGVDKITHVLKEVLPETNGKPYAPTITTPLDLEKKLGALIAWVKKESAKKNNNKIITI